MRVSTNYINAREKLQSLRKKEIINNKKLL